MFRTSLISRYNITHKESSDVFSCFILPVENNLKHVRLSVLTTEDYRRIMSYKNRIDREKRLLSRVFLFDLIHEAYELEKLELVSDDYYKPYINTVRELEFNFSYSGNYAAIGVSVNKRIGIDIEYISKEKRIEEIGKHIFTTSEMNYFNSLQGNETEQCAYFYKVFSQKEAILKAFGTGLYYDPRLIDTASRQFFYNDFSYRIYKTKNWDNNYSFAFCIAD